MKVEEETMSQEIARIAVKSAQESGWCARRDGQAKEENPYVTDGLRAAWRAGWERANGAMF